MGNLYETAKINSMKSWKLGTKYRLVKVKELRVVINSKNPQPSKPQVGYVTQEKYIMGLNPYQMQRDLGLKTNMLDSGAKIYELVRLPTFEEFEMKFGTDFPGGSVFEWPSEEDFESRNFWPPGKGCPQWEVTADIPLRLITKVLAHDRY